MGSGNWTLGGKAILIAKALALGGLVSLSAEGQPRVSNLKKVLILSPKDGYYAETSRDFGLAMQDLTASNGFEVTTISTLSDLSVLSASNLAGYQVVLFQNTELMTVSDSLKPGFESWVRNGGGIVSLHFSFGFLQNWPFMEDALVQWYYGPREKHGPTAALSHDPEGLMQGSETRGILKGLTAPAGFMNEYISFKASPRGEPGVTILVTVDEKTFSPSIAYPMGGDHPVAWVKKMGKGRVVHNSLGVSASGVNGYAQKDGYLKKLLYGSLRYAAGDFTGCADPDDVGYNPDATQSDPGACAAANPLRTRRPTRTAAPDIAFVPGEMIIRVDFRSDLDHEVILADINGKRMGTRAGKGAMRYEMAAPKRTGIYIVKASAGGMAQARRIFVP